MGVPWVLHPHGIASTFLKIYLWSPGVLCLLYPQREIARKKIKFYAYKKFNIFFKIMAQFRLGAIPCLPNGDKGVPF